MVPTSFKIEYDKIKLNKIKYINKLIVRPRGSEGPAMAGILGGQCHRGDGALWARSGALIQVILHYHCALI